MNAQSQPSRSAERYRGRFAFAAPEFGIPYLAAADLAIGGAHNRHAHHEVQVLWIVEGAMAMEVGALRHELTPGTTCVLLPEQVHRVAATPRPGRAVVVDLRLIDDEANPIWRFLRDAGPGPVFRGDPAGIVAAARQLESAVAETGSRRTSRVMAALWSMLGEVNAPSAHVTDRDAKPPPVDDPEAARDRRIALAERYMREHLANPIGVEDVAAAANLSRSQLTRLFLRLRAVSPGTRLRQLRVARAGELLATSTLSIKEVARVCGFVSQNHFSRTFFQVTGVRPSAHRAGRAD